MVHESSASFRSTMGAETTPTTEDEFGDELHGLVERALRNGVDVEGGWNCRFDDHPDFEVVIVETTGEE